MKEVIFSEKHIACAAFQFESSDQIMGLRCVDFQASKTTQKDIGEFTARFVLKFGRISSYRSGFIFWRRKNGQSAHVSVGSSFLNRRKQTDRQRDMWTRWYNLENGKSRVIKDSKETTPLICILITDLRSPEVMRSFALYLSNKARTT
jgi:hypothetical protein